MKHSMGKKAEDNPSCFPRTSGLGEMSAVGEVSGKLHGKWRVISTGKVGMVYFGPKIFQGRSGI